MNNLVCIHLIVEGVHHDTMYWPAVPRVGELVMINSGKETVEVTLVVWARDSMQGSPYYGGAWVQLACKRVAHAADD